MPSEFDPDWTMAPAVFLAEWMADHGMSAGAFARRCGHGESDLKCHLLVADVLERRPLLPAHAEMLERGTGMGEAFWLGAERTYRADLRHGRTEAPGG